MRDFPVEEAAHIGHARKLKSEQLAVQLEVLLRLQILIVLHALGDEHVLARVDHFVDLALDITELVLLLVKLVGLS